jgi:hypothetical protein
MESDTEKNQDFCCSFVLSKKQRLLGWPKISLYLIGLSLTLLFVPAWFFTLVYFPDSSKIGNILLLTMLVDVVIAILLFIWGPFYVLRNYIYNCAYINTLEIDPDLVKFGTDGLQVKLKTHSCSVTKGNFDTNILRFTSGNAFLVPNSFLTFDQLEKLIYAKKQ